MTENRSGWVTFSWLILLLAGLANALYGLAALGRADYFPEGTLVGESLSSHGWIWLILGAIQILVAIMIQRRNQMGLFAGLTLSVIAATIWFFYMLAIPNGGFALVLLYVLVIYGLGAHMQEFAKE